MTTHAARSRQGAVRPGFALPIAIFVLTFLALFVSGSAYLVMQEARSSYDALSERRALEAAEYGVAAVLRDWTASHTGSAVGARLGLWRHVLAGGAEAQVHAVRATPTTFWVISEGTATGTRAARGARRVVSALLRLDVPDVLVPAALTVADSAAVTGSGLVSGADTSAGGALLACVQPAVGGAGVTAPDSTRVCDGGCGVAAGRIQGAPPLRAESSAADPRLYHAAAGGAVAGLVARATITLPAGAVVTPSPVATNGVCDTRASGNWGDPNGASACAEHRPVIHALGDVTIAGGIGQGTLIAEGDIRLSAGATFVGLVIAGDDVVSLIGGGSILGAARAGDAVRAAGDHSRIADGGTVRLSACAVQRALLAAAPLRRVRSRWWAELF